MRPYFILLILSFLPFIGWSQISYDSVLLELLLRDTSDYKRFKPKQPLIWDSKIVQPGTAIIIEGELFYLPDLQGAIFKASRSRDSIRVTRLDHTIFTGNNAHHYCFWDGEKFYSFGGYGFWRTNGQLRMYLDDKKEWDIVRLNKELHSINDLTYFDPRTKDLWSCSSEFINEAVQEGSHFVDWEVYRLNINEKRWEEMGSFFLKDKKTSLHYRFICETSFGPLILMDGPKFQILDFQKNTRYDLGAISDSLLFYDQHQPEHGSVLNINGDIVLYDRRDGSGKPKSFKLSKNLLVDTGQPIYTMYSGLSFSAWFLAGVMLIMALFFVFKKFLINKEHRKPSKSDNSENHPGSVSKINEDKSSNLPNNILTTLPSFLDSLSPVELEVVNQIRKDNAEGRGTRTETVNKIIGTDRKNVDIQKKQRSDILLSINSKFQMYYRIQSALIVVKRSDVDRRLYEYYISEEINSIIDPG